jgi:peroxiredoxin
MGFVDSPQRGRSGALLTIVLAIVCAAMAVEIVLLVQKTRRLEARVAQLSATPKPPSIKPGDAFEPFDLQTESGEQVTVGFGEGQPKSLLLVFSMACHACERIFPTWRQLLPDVPPGVRVLPIRLDADAPDGAANPQLQAPIYALRNQQEMRDQLSAVPSTILLDPFGTVDQVWTGQLSERHQTSLREAIAFLSPGD